jgi:hypothetical protein
MKTPAYEDSTLVPLSTDALVRERAAALIGRAIRRQLWVMFLDEDDVQLPVLVPIEGLPAEPEAGDQLARALRELVDRVAAHSVVLVLERYGGEELTASDRAWASALHDATAAGAVRLRGILLSHRRGVGWVAQDDYRF